MKIMKTKLMESFVDRHVGPDAIEQEKMLAELGTSSLEELSNKTVPSDIRIKGELRLENEKTESELLVDLRKIALRNEVYKSYIGLGYYDTITPHVILRNIFENPGWYTQYTPYQAEISQGRLEALIAFQTMISDLTGLEISNASLLDEATAAAEAMTMCFSAVGKQEGRVPVFAVSSNCFPQTIEVVRTRAEPFGIEVKVVNDDNFNFDLGGNESVFAILVQYPTADGIIKDYRQLVEKAHSAGAMVIMAADIMSLALLKSPGELGADVAVGSTQRFGIPMGFGGPHAAYFATRDQHKRRMPGRIIGLSKDAEGRQAYRLALQTREQHIRREKATSNICTAQVLLAIMAAMYCVYHGPRGLKSIAERIHSMTALLAGGLRKLGYRLGDEAVFDTLKIPLGDVSADKLIKAAESRKINFRTIDSKNIGVSIDEATSVEDVFELLEVLAMGKKTDFNVNDLKTQFEKGTGANIPKALLRELTYLTQPVFNRYHSETEMLRYIRRLEARDLSLTTSMIPLGSCTMKLNASAEMYPVSWPEFGSLHPFAPATQTQGYLEMIHQLEKMLCEVTGFSAISFQPNAGSQGEYTGLLVIRKYHQQRGDNGRNVCLIPKSAHGTNPASAALAGMHIVIVDCDSNGNIDIGDLKKKAEENARSLAALMVTYPSTHGVFEEGIKDICNIVHNCGGQVYMDGANLNAQVGLCRPAEIGADVCHMNLHKTFAIPHGGGGPGMGPIGVKPHLAPYLPAHPVVDMGLEKSNRRIGSVSAAPWGSPSILPISWMYIRLMGAAGLKKASQAAILNANYIAKRLDPHYPVLYRGARGLVAHECIVDLRPIKAETGIDVEDVAKRLMDYGFHAPTVSFPVAGTMMIEPTESESKAELDRFCDAMILIKQELDEIRDGKMDRQNNPLKNAPHTASAVTSQNWDRPYSRERAAFPASWTKEHKFWPAVGRIDNVYGDRNLVCTFPC